MAFQTTRTDGEAQGTINATWYNDFMQALTGVMNDQPIYIYYEPSSGSNPPALKLQTNGNAHTLQIFNSGGTLVADFDSTGLFSLSGYYIWNHTLGGSNSIIMKIEPTDGGDTYGFNYNTDNSLNIYNYTSSTNLLKLSSGGALTILGAINTDNGGLYSNGSGSLTASAVTASNFYGYLNGNISGNANYANSAGSATNATNSANVTTIRNGSGTNVPIYTGTNTPSSPPTGSIWIKA